MTLIRKNLLLLILLSAFFGGGFFLSGLWADDGTPVKESTVAVSLPDNGDGSMSETSNKQDSSALDPCQLGRIFRLGLSQNNSSRTIRSLLRMQNFADSADDSDVDGNSGTSYLYRPVDYAFFCEYIAGILPVRAGPCC